MQYSAVSLKYSDYFFFLPNFFPNINDFVLFLLIPDRPLGRNWLASAVTLTGDELQFEPLTLYTSNRLHKEGKLGSNVKHNVKSNIIESTGLRHWDTKSDILMFPSQLKEWGVLPSSPGVHDVCLTSTQS